VDCPEADQEIKIQANYLNATQSGFPTCMSYVNIAYMYGFLQAFQIDIMQ